eukprot:gene17281-biopygen9824
MSHDCLRAEEPVPPSSRCGGLDLDGSRTRLPPLLRRSPRRIPTAGEFATLPPHPFRKDCIRLAGRRLARQRRRLTRYTGVRAQRPPFRLRPPPTHR